MSNVGTPTAAMRKFRGKRIVLTTFGSLGDLHPFLAVALELKARGYEAVIATHASFRALVESKGIGFHAVRPDTTDFGEEAAALKCALNVKSGPEYVIRQMFLPHLRASYDDLTAAVQGAALLVTHTASLAGPLVAEKQRIAWVSTTLAPISFFSAYDPPVLPPVPSLSRLRRLGPSLHRPLFRLMKHKIHHWTAPVRALRQDIGLPPCSLDPLLAGQFSPRLNLALFSPQLADPQPDWPLNTVLTGFPFYNDSYLEQQVDPALDAFLKNGEPPLVFTLGSSVVNEAGNFYQESADAARRLGMRALMLIGSDPRNRFAALPEGMAAFQYAPYSEVFPRAAAVIHQGGIGTTAQALRAGCLQLVVPFFLDQPDNAARVTRLGVARTLPRKRYTAARAEAELRDLLTDARCGRKADEVRTLLREEEGTKVACDRLETILNAKRVRR